MKDLLGVYTNNALRLCDHPENQETALQKLSLTLWHLKLSHIPWRLQMDVDWDRNSVAL